MSVARSTTVERLRSRRKQAGTASVPTPVPQHTRKLAELWSDAAAKMAPSDVDAAWARLKSSCFSGSLIGTGRKHSIFRVFVLTRLLYGAELCYAV